MFRCEECKRSMEGWTEDRIASCKGCNGEFCSERCLEKHLAQREDCREEY